MGFLSSLLGRWRGWSASAGGFGSPGSGSSEYRFGLREHDAGLGCLMGRLRVYSISGAGTKPPSPGGQASGPLAHEALRAGGDPRPAAGISPMMKRRPFRTEGSGWGR